MQQLLFSIVLCLLALSSNAQNQSAERIEQKIEQYELKIEEKERQVSMNIANGITRGNRALKADIVTYELEIQKLLKELRTVQNTDRTEAAFMALQQQINDLEGEVKSYSKENAQLKAEIVALKKQLSSGSSTKTKPHKFTAGNIFRDSRDGEEYKTVQIGNQVWMAENMRYKVQGSSWNSANPSKKYGRLYTWEQAQHVCPLGWHLPSEEEWALLIDALGGEQLAGKKLMSVHGWKAGAEGNNSSGFNAFPAGYQSSSGFHTMGKYAYFWSSTATSMNAAWYSRLYYSNSEMKLYTNTKSYARSCRCIQ